jgi:hypothetical protein
MDKTEGIDGKKGRDYPPTKTSGMLTSKDLLISPQPKL